MHGGLEILRKGSGCATVYARQAAKENPILRNAVLGVGLDTILDAVHLRKLRSRSFHPNISRVSTG